MQKFAMDAEYGQTARVSVDGMSVLVTGPDYDGFLAIDSIVNGTSSGGVRAAEDLDLSEIQELAREMSLKFALFHLPRGGAKAGVRLAAGLDETRRLAAFTDFGSKLAPLIRAGIYNPGMDMNCGPTELRTIYQGAGIELGPITDTSWFTALTVYYALRACISALSLEHRPITLAIEGFGSVARHLSERLDPSDFRVVAVSTVEGAARSQHSYEPGELARLKVHAGDRFVLDLPGEQIDSEDLFSCRADILIPSSRTWTLTPDLARRVRAAAIVPIANAPYAAGSLELLSENKVVCLPGYLCNVGGVLASTLYDYGVKIAKIERLLSTEHCAIVEGIIRVAEKRDVSATDIAASVAQMHMPYRTAVPNRSLPVRVYDRLLRRRLPKRVGAWFAHREFSRRLQSVRIELQRMEHEK